MLQWLLPAWMPSWRFFDSVGPSPRLEYAWLERADESPIEPHAWQEFEPRPTRVPRWAMLAHLFWDPRGNERLYRLTCCERLIEQASSHAELALDGQLRAAWERDGAVVPHAATHYRFRVMLRVRDGQALVDRVGFVSEARACPERLGQATR